MDWLQKAVPYPGDIDGVEKRFEQLFKEGGAPADHALFTRTSIDGNSEIYLLTPAAAAWAPRIGGGWTPAEDPNRFGWGLLVGADDAFRRFGLNETKTIDSVNPSRGT